jgi:multifunctional methyltransferase subunit TRM112
MKLMTHNLLTCNKKGCTTNNFPLKIIVAQTGLLNIDYDEDLVKRMLKKLDLPALTSACKDVGLYKFDFENLKSEEFENVDILKYIHHCIFEFTIQTGELQCPGCGKGFPINDGIPNLILNDDEI